MLQINKSDDGSIINEKGEYIYFSIDKFIKDICIGDCCFICGSSDEDVEFNNEHVLPNWILKKYNLHSRKITLPNLTEFRYDQYTIPCCEKCNSLMNRVFEKPIHHMINNGYEAVYNYLKKNGTRLFFNWMALIYIKTHLKDKHLRLFRDNRKGDETISDFYEWEDLHHIHCIARSFYTKAQIDKNAFGSFIVLPANVELHFEKFDYGDIYLGRALLLRMDEMCFFAVLNDSCYSQTFFKDHLLKISGHLSPIQIREVLARLAFFNVFLKERPKFWSDVNLETGYYCIGADKPDTCSLRDFTSHDYGKFIYSSIRDMLSHVVNTDRDQIIEHVKEGNYSFLFDKNGDFINNSMKIKEK